MHYSIKYLQDISGVKAHTIRIWEQRYKLLKPKRTASNIRYYNDDQLRKILNVTALLNAGHKISRIGEMSDAQLHSALRQHLNENENNSDIYGYFINELIISSLNFDKLLFESHFNSCVLKFGFSQTIENVLYPTLKRVGVLWQSEELNPSQEHFISNLVKQKLYSAIDGLPVPVKSQSNCLLFLPENEHHEIGLLFFNYLLLKSGITTIYLGENVPVENVKQAEKVIRPSHLVLFMIKAVSGSQVNKYIGELCKMFPAQKILLSGKPEILEKVKPRTNLVLINSPESARKYFKLPVLNTGL